MEPATPTRVPTRSSGTVCAARSKAACTSAAAAATWGAVGGSAWNCRSVSRTDPMSKEMALRTCAGQRRLLVSGDHFHFHAQQAPHAVDEFAAVARIAGGGGGHEPQCFHLVLLAQPCVPLGGAQGALQRLRVELAGAVHALAE